RVLGMFINTLPVRIRVGQSSVQGAVLQTHELLTELLRHEHASLATAQRCSGVRAPAPLFTALLNYRHSRVGRSTKEGTQAWEGIEFLGGKERTNYPLVLSVDDLGQDFGLTAQAQTPVDASAVCDLMQQALVELVRALESAPDRSLGELDVVP